MIHQQLERGKDMSHLSEEQLDNLIADEFSRPRPPLNEWRTIAARAREEGLLRESQTSRAWASAQPWLQAAAAVLILVGGIAIGRTNIAVPSGDTRTVWGFAQPDAVAASNSAPISSFRSVEEASATLDRAVSDYQRA